MIAHSQRAELRSRLHADAAPPAANPPFAVSLSICVQYVAYVYVGVHANACLYVTIAHSQRAELRSRLRADAAPPAADLLFASVLSNPILPPNRTKKHVRPCDKSNNNNTHTKQKQNICALNNKKKTDTKQKPSKPRIAHKNNQTHF